MLCEGDGKVDVHRRSERGLIAFMRAMWAVKYLRMTSGQAKTTDARASESCASGQNDGRGGLGPKG